MNSSWPVTSEATTSLDGFIVDFSGDGTGGTLPLWSKLEQALGVDARVKKLPLLQANSSGSSLLIIRDARRSPRGWDAHGICTVVVRVQKSFEIVSS